MDDLISAIHNAALETVINLLQDEDPYVRLQTALAILAGVVEPQMFIPGPGETGSYDENEFDATMAAAPNTAMVPATAENVEEIERKLAAAQAVQPDDGEKMPKGFKSGNSGIGSGRPRRR